MTTQPGADDATYDDPDADPANLNPRTDAAAAGDDDETLEDRPDDLDPDADPANLNPRSTLDEPQG